MDIEIENPWTRGHCQNTRCQILLIYHLPIKSINKCMRQIVSFARTQNYFLQRIFSTNVPLLYPLKTSENRRFCDVFRGYRSATLAENGLIMPLCMRNRTSLRKVLWNKKLPLYLLTQNLSLTQDVFKFISLFLQIWWFSGNNLCLDWNGSFISFSNLDTIFSSEKWEEPIKVHPNILELAKGSSTFSF